MPRKINAEDLDARSKKEEAASKRHKLASMKLRLTGIVDKHPSLLPTVLEHAEGLLKEHLGEKEPPLPVPEIKVNPSTKAIEDKKIDISSKSIDRHCSRLEKLAAIDLKWILGRLNPCLFTEWNLRCLKSHGQREVPKAVLCEYIELRTGVPGDTPLPGEWFRSLADVLEYVQENRKNLGSIDRSQFMSLPCDWVLHGLFMLESVDSEAIILAHRFSGVRLRIPNNTLFAWTHPDKLKIAKNFSAAQARLVEDETPKSFPLAEFFHADGKWKSHPWLLKGVIKVLSEFVSDSPGPSKKPRLALEGPLMQRQALDMPVLGSVMKAAKSKAVAKQKLKPPSTEEEKAQASEAKDLGSDKHEEDDLYQENQQEEEEEEDKHEDQPDADGIATTEDGQQSAEAVYAPPAPIDENDK